MTYGSGSEKVCMHATYSTRDKEHWYFVLGLYQKKKCVSKDKYPHVIPGGLLECVAHGSPFLRMKTDVVCDAIIEK